MAHIDSHCDLVLHHLHELSESCILRRRNQMVLPCCVLSISISIVNHVSDKTYLQQVRVLRHLAEFESEFLLGGIVEVGTEEGGFVGMSVLPNSIINLALLLAIFFQLLNVQYEKIDLANNDLVCQWVLGRDWVLLMVA